jgi:competence protein ComEC
LERSGKEPSLSRRLNAEPASAGNVTLPDFLRHPNSRTTSKAPLAALAASFALGILWAHSARATVGVAWFLASAGVCLLVGLILLRSGWQRTAVWFALAGLVPTGVAAARLYERRFPPNHVSHLESLGVDLSDPVRLEGRVISTPYRTGYGLQFDVEAERLESRAGVYAVTGKVRLRLQGAEDFDASPGAGPLELQYGDRIRTLVSLRKPHIYRNPGSFDFRRWMEDIEDVYWIGAIKNPRLIEMLGRAPGFSLAACLERVRQRLLRGIDDLYPPWSAQERYGAVLKAVLWGDRTSLDSDTIEDFRKTGLYHLLVIAGLHVGLLTLLLAFLLRPFRWTATTKSLVVLGFLASYSLLVEQRAPTLRATLMIALCLVARLLDRDHSALNAIGCAALILLYLRPAWLFESGFQLSFAAALLIVGVAVPLLERTTEPYRRALHRLDDVLLDDRFAPRLAQVRLELRVLTHTLRRRVRFLDRHPALARSLPVAPLRLLVWAANILVFSAVLQLGLLLPMVETFHRVTFAGVGLNALAIPVMTLLLALALPINLLSVAAPAVAVWPAKALSLVMAVLFGLTHLPGLAAWLSYRVPEPPRWVAWGFCGAFVLAAWALRFARRAVGVTLTAAAVFVALVALHPFAPRLPRGTLELTALDCGQGDALFLVLPDQTTMLLDAGGSRTWGAREGGPTGRGRRWDPGEDIVSPYLWSRGIKKIDVVALTHADADHLGGLGAIIDNFRVGEVWHVANLETPPYAALLAKVAKRGIPIRTLFAGDTISRGEASIRVLWPTRQRPVSPFPSNDDSLVMRISAPGVSLLLPGDANRNVEKQLLASGEPLGSQVLKVAQHGAKPFSSPEFLARVAPRVAIVTSGFGGFGNLPNPASLEVLRNAGARIVRTDAVGATTVQWAAGSLVVRTYGAGESVVETGAATPEGVRRVALKAVIPAKSLP